MTGGNRNLDSASKCTSENASRNHITSGFLKSEVALPGQDNERLASRQRDIMLIHMSLAGFIRGRMERYQLEKDVDFSKRPVFIFNTCQINSNLREMVM